MLRVSRLADDLPEVTDLDLNPVIAREDGVFAVDARIKVTPYEPQDPGPHSRDLPLVSPASPLHLHSGLLLA